MRSIGARPSGRVDPLRISGTILYSVAFLRVLPRLGLESPLAKRGRRIKSGLALEPAHKDIFEKAREAGATATCFFNNKGGVGKTTLVANLGAELALSFGAKILVVDADPQCNLTQYTLGEEESLAIYSSDDPRSIFSVIRPLSLGKGYGSSLPIRPSPNFGFDLIIGDPRLALQEDLLANDWRDARGGGMRGLRTTFVFADLVKKAKELNYDFVFFDMGPSLGAINRSILLAMDFFVVPMSIDIFSAWAIKNIGFTVSVWQKELRTGLSLAEEPQELLSSDRSRYLQFLGYVTQQHKERAREDDTNVDENGSEADNTDDDSGSEDIEAKRTRRKRLVQAYEDINLGFPKQIAKYLSGFYDDDTINPHLGNIRHLASLAPMSQSQHRPMISVAGKGSYTQLRAQAREIYREIAFRYMENLVKVSNLG